MILLFKCLIYFSPKMLIKIINKIQPRYFNQARRCLSSQSVQTSHQLSKADDRKPSSPVVTLKSDQSLSEVRPQDLAKIIKSPVEMDIYFETRLKEIPVVKKKKLRDSIGGVSADTLAEMHKKWDTSWYGIKNKIRQYINLREMHNQRYIARRHAILGPELATAHFMVYRGGKVRFKHAPKEWICDCDKLPPFYDSKYRLIAVDASDLKLRWEALDNMITLNSLEELNLSNNKLLDDFCCDKIARLFRNSKHLSVLDLSDNPLISHRGIETLYRIRSLKRLVIKGTKAANYPFIELLIILFNDVNPNCEIITK